MSDGLNELEKVSLLYDFYGELLPEKQKEFLRLYHEENYSLAEIAEGYGLSRQGVYDAVHKAEESLRNYENKLGLLERHLENRRLLDRIKQEISGLAAARAGDKALSESLGSIAGLIEDLGE